MEDENLSEELQALAKVADAAIIPQKSALRYEMTYNTFIKWLQGHQQSGNFEEKILKAYFVHLRANMAPNTLWAIHSMLKTMLKAKHNVDISRYTGVIAYLKAQNKSYTPKKAGVFLPEEISEFLYVAPDDVYLAHKVITIFGIFGACRSQEIADVKVSNVELHKKVQKIDLDKKSTGIGHEEFYYVIKIPTTKTNISWSFTISEPYFSIVQYCANLRPEKCKIERFFLNFQKGKCTNQPIGKNKISQVPATIAKYLNLENADKYTGHSFRRTSATMLADSGGDMLELQRHGGWQSATVARSYVDESVTHKQKTENKITSELNLSDHFPTNIVKNTEKQKKKKWALQNIIMLY